MFVAHPSPAPPPDEALQALRQVSVSTLGHLTDFGFPTGLTPLFRSAKIVGPAVTVRIPHIDHTAVHVAIDHLRPVAVLPPDTVTDVARLLAEKEAAEPELKIRLDAGDSLAELSGARTLFDNARHRRTPDAR